MAVDEDRAVDAGRKDEQELEFCERVFRRENWAFEVEKYNWFLESVGVAGEGFEEVKDFEGWG